MPSRSGYFLFAHFWIHEDEVHRKCRCSMNIHDKLPAVVGRAIHESDFYTEPAAEDCRGAPSRRPRSDLFRVSI